MISHIDHLVLTVADIDRAVDFYEKVLQMEAISFAEGRRAVRFGKQKINFQTLGQELRNHAMEGSGDLCLISNWALDEVIAHLQQHEVTIIEGPVEKSGATGPIQSVYFNDPDNNLIEISVLQHVDEELIEDAQSDTVAKDETEEAQQEVKKATKREAKKEVKKEANKESENDTKDQADIKEDEKG